MGRQGRGKEAETHLENRRGKGEQEPSSLAGEGGECASNLLGLSLQHPLSRLRAPGPQAQQKAMVPTLCPPCWLPLGLQPPHPLRHAPVLHCRGGATLPPPHLRRAPPPTLSPPPGPGSPTKAVARPRCGSATNHQGTRPHHKPRRCWAQFTGQGPEPWRGGRLRHHLHEEEAALPVLDCQAPGSQLWSAGRLTCNR